MEKENLDSFFTMNFLLKLYFYAKQRWSLAAIQVAYHQSIVESIQTFVDNIKLGSILILAPMLWFLIIFCSNLLLQNS